MKLNRGTAVRRSTRWGARIGVAAMIASMLVLATSATAFADAPDVTSTSGTVLNKDYVSHWVEIQVSGDWAWSTHKNKDCNDDRWATGWNVDWNDADQAGNPVTTLGSDSIDVGVLDGSSGSALNATDNEVHVPASAPRCGVYGPHGAISYNTGTWGPMTHKYVLPDDVNTDDELATWLSGPDGPMPCALTYDVHGKGTDLAPNNPAKELKAGGSNHNGDNSAEKNNQTPAGNVCAQIGIVLPEADVSIVKTGPAQVTAGDTITYTLTIRNDGQVATSATILDDIPATTIFVSASPECHLDTDDPNLIICQFGSLAPGATAQVTITVRTTVAGTVVNTGIVTPEDDTPNDNTSTVSTIVVAPAALAVVVTPTFTG